LIYFDDIDEQKLILHKKINFEKVKQYLTKIIKNNNK